MNKILIFFLVLCILSFSADAQNVGIGIAQPKARLHVADSSVLFTAPTTLIVNAGNPPLSGPGNRMMWYADKASFRAGGVQTTEWDGVNIGQYSFAANYGNRASGASSAAFGSFTLAAVGNAFAAGSSTEATGFNTAAFGQNSKAIGNASFVTGIFNRAEGDLSFIAGQNNIASGTSSAAFGLKNHVKAMHGFVVGMYNDSTDTPSNGIAAPGDRLFQIGNGSADNARSNALTILRNGMAGIGTTTPKARLHVADSAVVFTNQATNLNSTSPPPVQGSGIRMMWYPQKAAFRAGAVDNGFLVNNAAGNYPNNRWDKDSIGEFSTAFGYNTLASGFFSFAAGNTSLARNWGSVALGEQNLSSGFASFSAGYANSAANFASIALGESNVASGTNSFAVGKTSEAKGTNSMALGYNAIANASYTTALGYSTRANGSYATAIGFSSVADGTNALATGQNTSASGAYSSSFGWQTNAKALGAMAVGVYNDNTDNPNTSIEQSTDRIFQIGNGNSGVRSNALTVLRNGNSGVGVTDPVFILDVGARMRIRATPGFTAGLWLNNEANTASSAFVGMRSDTELGFYGQTGTFGWRFYVNTTTGNAFLQGGLTQNSDARLKKDIIPLSNSLEAIQQLSGYSYHWKDASNPDEQIGLLAQEIQKVYPQLVKENEQGTLSVNYSGMVPVLLEAIKEQQKQIEELKKMLMLMNEKAK
jgi:hypothetical protein